MVSLSNDLTATCQAHATLTARYPKAMMSGPDDARFRGLPDMRGWNIGHCSHGQGPEAEFLNRLAEQGCCEDLLSVCSPTQSPTPFNACFPNTCPDGS